MTTSLIVISLLISSAHSFHKLSEGENGILKEYCGKSLPQSSVFKVLGPDAGPRRFPWAVTVSAMTDKLTIDDNTGAVLATEVNPSECSGTLISRRHVITAAHCFFNEFIRVDKHGKGVSKGDSHVKIDLDINIGLGGITNDQDKPDHLKYVWTKYKLLATNEAQDLSAARGLDYAFVELVEDITDEDMNNYRIMPVCLVKNMNIPRYDTTFVLAAFGKICHGAEERLRYNEVRETLCEHPPGSPVPMRLLVAPECKCFSGQQSKLSVSQEGDSGGGYYLYGTEDPPRAYLFAVQFQKRSVTPAGSTVEIDVDDVGVAVMNAFDSDIINLIRSVFNISYSLTD